MVWHPAPWAHLASTDTVDVDRPACRRRHWLRWHAGWLVVPAVLFLLLFFAYPLLQVLQLSILDPELTAKHYLSFFQKPAYMHVAVITFRLALTVTLLCLVLGYPVAYVLAAISPRARALLMIPVLLPFVTSLLVRTYAWMVLLGREGLVNQLLMWLGLTDTPLALVHNSIGVHIGMAQILLPFMILPLYSVMAGIDRQFVLAAYNLGASPAKAFRLVYLPLSFPGVAAGCSLVFIISLGFFITPALLGGPGDITIPILIEYEVGEALNWPFASALAVILLVATLGIVLLLGRFLGFDRIWAAHS